MANNDEIEEDDDDFVDFGGIGSGNIAPAQQDEELDN